MIGFWTRADSWGRKITPGGLAMLLVVLGAVNTWLPGFSAIVPLFSVMAVYYWAICWPEAMPRWFVFFLGLFQDITYNTPPGISSLLLLILLWVVTSQRRHLLKEPFIILWLMFALSVAGYGAADWLLSSLWYKHLFLDDAVWIRLLLSVMVYPCVHTLFTGVHVSIMRKQAETRRHAE